MGREEILRMHLMRRRIEPETLVMHTLVSAMHGFTGAEIEQLVLDALYDAFSEDERTRPQMRHFEARLATIKPLIKTIGARDKDGRAGALDEVWALIDQGRVEPASDNLLTQAQVAKLIDPFLYRQSIAARNTSQALRNFSLKVSASRWASLMGGRGSGP